MNCRKVKLLEYGLCLMCVLCLLPVILMPDQLQNKYMDDYIKIIMRKQRVPKCSTDEDDIVKARLHNLRKSVHLLSSMVTSSPAVEVSSGKKEIEKTCEHYEKESKLHRPFLTNVDHYQKPKYLGSTNELEDDITMVTQMSVDRLFNLNQILIRWSGPVSVSVGLKPTELETVQDVVKKFEACQELLRRRNLSVHLVAIIGVCI